MCKDTISKQGHILKCWRLGLQLIFWWGIHSSVQTQKHWVGVKVREYMGTMYFLLSFSLNYVVFSCLAMPNSLWPHELWHTRLLCPSLSSWVCSNSCPWSQWCHPTISSSVAPFSSCPQSFPASRSFPMNQFFALGGQSIGVSASALPRNIQAWFPLGLTGLIFFPSKGLSRVFFSTTVQKHQFFGAQPSL